MTRVINDVISHVRIDCTAGTVVIVSTRYSQQRRDYDYEDVKRWAALIDHSVTPALDLQEFFEGEFGRLVGEDVARTVFNHINQLVDSAISVII